MTATRLYFIVARTAPVAVVFRRGPSRQVELLKWNLESDQIEAGQWLKGRIFERRCDLSPSGDLLVYFAAKFETEMRTWTAISRPPHLTALALWPKGDAWGGGGLFDSERHLRLNHRPGEFTMAPGFRLAPSMKVTAFGERPGWGEDDPIHSARLERDGWTWLDRDTTTRESRKGPLGWAFDPPLAYRRSIGPPDGVVTLEMTVEGINERQGPWYAISYRLLAGGALVRELGRLDWADRAPNGDLLMARDGHLLRATATSVDEWRSTEFRIVANLRAHVFEPREAPAEAQRW